MKLLLLAVGLSLLCILQAHHGNAENAEQSLSGDWRSARLTSDDPSLIEEGGKFRLYIRNINEHKRGDLVGHFFMKKFDRCIPIMMVGAKTDTKGAYHVYYYGTNDLHLSVQKNDYVIFVAHNSYHGKEAVIVNLFTKTGEVSEEAETAFKNICTELGLKEENTVDMTKDGCSIIDWLDFPSQERF
ncbi:trichosurin-like [Dromiciops gliroides]|uniref:trichosurin-like n=1 Tax=Dromiciops gliroides TaxID=33562 RepID=UPI001CC4E7E2|nr:trichosurin-like [Dromiciops gliroides]